MLQADKKLLVPLPGARRFFEYFVVASTGIKPRGFGGLFPESRNDEDDDDDDKHNKSQSRPHTGFKDAANDFTGAD
jgi:hypothetical protein